MTLLGEKKTARKNSVVFNKQNRKQTRAQETAPLLITEQPEAI